jgi:hypothetical protein
LRRREVIVTGVTVTVTMTVAVRPPLSVTTNLHVPDATGVTVNVAGVLVDEAGDSVAMPLHDGLPFVIVSGPV